VRGGKWSSSFRWGRKRSFRRVQSVIGGEGDREKGLCQIRYRQMVVEVAWKCIIIHSEFGGRKRRGLHVISTLLTSSARPRLINMNRSKTRGENCLLLDPFVSTFHQIHDTNPPSHVLVIPHATVMSRSSVAIGRCCLGLLVPLRLDMNCPSYAIGTDTNTDRLQTPGRRHGFGMTLPILTEGRW